jgi:hypothetical protein
MGAQCEVSDAEWEEPEWYREERRARWAGEERKRGRRNKGKEKGPETHSAHKRSISYCYVGPRSAITRLRSIPIWPCE